MQKFNDIACVKMLYAISLVDNCKYINELLDYINKKESVNIYELMGKDPMSTMTMIYYSMIMPDTKTNYVMLTKEAIESIKKRNATNSEVANLILSGLSKEEAEKHVAEKHKDTMKIIFDSMIKMIKDLPDEKGT